jgi:group I intron endonuclease
MVDLLQHKNIKKNMRAKCVLQSIYVYIITNNITDKKYVGSHMCYAKNDSYMGSSKLLSEDIKKYGIENFSKKILSYYNLNISKEEFLDEETKYILEYNTLSPNGYNMFLPNEKYGFHTMSKICSDETKQKMKKPKSEKAKLNMKNAHLDSFGENNSMYGKNQTLYTKNKIRQSLIGRIPSDEERKNMSIAGKGRIFSDEHRKNLSNALKNADRSKSIGQKRSDETKEHISKALLGRIFSDEHRKNLSISRKGKPLTVEHKNKISLSLNKNKNNK